MKTLEKCIIIDGSCLRLLLLEIIAGLAGVLIWLCSACGTQVVAVCGFLGLNQVLTGRRGRGQRAVG